MNQWGVSELEFAAKKKQTRRERFLGQIEAATPWPFPMGLIEPVYPKGERGRPAIGFERMLRMSIVQECFGLSAEGTEDTLYDSQSMRAFVGIDLSREGAPDATMLLHFRRLLEKHDLTRAIFQSIKGHLAEQALLLREGTIVDATIIAAPPSIKNRAKTQVRAIVEHPFHVVKNLFRYRKVRYRGLHTNTAQVLSVFALGNLMRARRWLPPEGVIAS